MDRTYIIGSGPTGVAAAKALLDAGRKVTMLDAGICLEEDKQHALDQTSTTLPPGWNPHSIANFKSGIEATAKGIPLKLAYGSDFPYRQAEQFIVANENVGILPSLARGGLSNVWGAAMLPFNEADTEDWPIDMKELAPHYAAAIELTGLAGQVDDLDDIFPLFVEPHQEAPIGSIIKGLLHDMEDNRDALRKQKIVFGRSRLAIKRRNQHGLGCAACRMCMYGCPLELIYNSSMTLSTLRENQNFTYHPNVIVKTFEESADFVAVAGHDTSTGEDISFHAERLFIAAGTLSTTRLVLESIGGPDQQVSFKDSQYFLLPLLRHQSPASFDANEPEHTLSQAFIEIFDEAVSKRSIHLQAYGYNELYREAVGHTLGPLQSIASPIITSFLRRFVLFQGYLHSDYSHEIEARLLPRLNGALTGRLLLSVKHNPETRNTIRRLTAKLSSLKKFLKATPLTPLLKLGTPGRGFHTGSSFPMTRSPQQLETDTMGRPGSCRRTHIVDSSVFPSIPASTITLTAMANAHRIASKISE